MDLVRSLLITCIISGGYLVCIPTDQWDGNAWWRRVSRRRGLCCSYWWLYCRIDTGKILQAKACPGTTGQEDKLVVCPGTRCFPDTHHSSFITHYSSIHYWSLFLPLSL